MQGITVPNISLNVYRLQFVALIFNPLSLIKCICESSGRTSPSKKITLFALIKALKNDEKYLLLYILPNISGRKGNQTMKFG